MRVWPGEPAPLGATFDGIGTNFSVYAGGAAKVELCLFDDDGAETARRAAGDDRGLLARLLPRRRARPALRLPRARPVESGRRPALQPGQAPARPVRARHRRARSSGTRPCSDTTSTTPTAATTRTARRHVPRSVVVNPFFDWEGDRAPRIAVERDGHLRDPRQGHHGPPSRRAGRATRHVRRPRAPRLRRAPHAARRHRGRAAARPPVRARRSPRRARACATTGATARSASSRRTTSTPSAARPANRCRTSSRW